MIPNSTNFCWRILQLHQPIQPSVLSTKQEPLHFFIQWLLRILRWSRNFVIIKMLKKIVSPIPLMEKPFGDFTTLEPHENPKPWDPMLHITALNFGEFPTNWCIQETRFSTTSEPNVNLSDVFSPTNCLPWTLLEFQIEYSNSVTVTLDVTFHFFRVFWCFLILRSCDPNVCVHHYRGMMSFTWKEVISQNRIHL